jgi:GntR family transcriptional regulator
MNKNPILQNQLTMDNSIPLYYQLAEIIRRCITVGTLKQGDLLPSEAEITEAYQISRSTVRQAFEILQTEGLVSRRRGKGTFVSIPKLRRRLDNMYSFSNEMNQIGLVPHSKIISFEKMKPSLHVYNKLNMKSENDPVFKVTRVRMANEEPLLIETTIIPVKICPFLKEGMLERDSLYRILIELAGVNPYYAIESYEPVIFKKREAELLNNKPGMCGYSVERTSYLNTNEVFEFTQSLVRGDRCRFEVELFKSSVNFSRRFDSKTI